MKTLVIGASVKAERYAYKAVSMLNEYGHEVIAIGNREGQIGDVDILLGQPDIEGVHTITLYINPTRQEAYIEYLLDLNPSRIIFNPGTENLAFYSKAKEQGIEVLNACTLVMLRTGQYT